MKPETKSILTDFSKKVQELQPEEAKGFMPGVIRYSKRKLVFDFGAAVLGGHIGGPVGAASGIVISETALSKLANNPMIGRLAIQALETPAGSPQAQLMSKALLYGMRGTAVMLQMSDGTKEKGEVSDDGTRITTPHPAVPLTLLHKPAESYQAQ